MKLYLSLPSVVLVCCCLWEQVKSIEGGEEIAGGQAGSAESNSIVGIKSPDSALMYICTGFILTTQWVLTAAHCLAPFNGNYTLYVSDDQVKEIKKYPSIKRSIFSNDIALLRLASPISESNPSGVISMISSSSNFSVGANCSVTGWGIDGHLWVTRVPIIDHATCKQQYLEETGDIVTDNMICAGYQQVDKGDSGGPLVCKEHGKDFLVGIEHWGVQAGRPSVYTKINNYLDWINGIITPAEEEA